MSCFQVKIWRWNLLYAEKHKNYIRCIKLTFEGNLNIGYVRKKNMKFWEELVITQFFLFGL
jgi:hypothetical protein